MLGLERGGVLRTDGSELLVISGAFQGPHFGLAIGRDVTAVVSRLMVFFKLGRGEIAQGQQPCFVVQKLALGHGFGRPAGQDHADGVRQMICVDVNSADVSENPLHELLVTFLGADADLIPGVEDEYVAIDLGVAKGHRRYVEDLVLVEEQPVQRS